MRILKKNIFAIKTNVLNAKLRKANTNAILPKNIVELERLNLEKRKKIVEHAFNNTKYYKDKFKGKLPNTLTDFSEEDFQNLPILTRQDLKDHFSDILSEKVTRKDYYTATTGGSTGSPISVLHDKRAPLTPIQWRVLKWWGLKPYDNSAYIYRLRRTGVNKLLNYIMWWPTKRVFLDASEMTNDSINKFIKQYNKAKPTLIQGYVGAVYEFALYLKDHNIRITPPKAVWVTSAPMNSMQRRTMEEIYQAPVYDQYGTCEVMWLAAECKEKKGLHMMSDIRYIEFVDDDNKPVARNNWGRILITDLTNYAFPLIRYDIGDKGRRLDFQCKCGVALPLMDSVKGRKSDVIKTPKGIIISGEYLTTIFDEYPDAVREFQVVQEKNYSIRLLYVTNNNDIIASVLKNIIRNLKDKTNNEIIITTEEVSQINHFKGKTQFIISHLK